MKYNIEPLAELKGNIASQLADVCSMPQIKFKYDNLKLYTNIIKSDDFTVCKFSDKYKLSHNNVLYYELSTDDIRNALSIFNVYCYDEVMNDNPIASRMNAQIYFGFINNDNWDDTSVLGDNILKCIETKSQSIRQKSLNQINNEYNSLQRKRAYVPLCVLHAIIHCCKISRS